MRRGELLGLQWRDIIGTTIKIERQLLPDLSFDLPKGRRKRKLEIPETTVDMLAEHRRKQLELRMQLGMGKPPADALVFCDHEAAPIPPRKVSVQWRRSREAAGQPDVMFHALRHTHASALIAAGVDIVTISKRLGHRSPTITLRVYAHLFSNTDSGAAEAIAKVLGGQSVGKSAK